MGVLGMVVGIITAHILTKRCKACNNKNSDNDELEDSYDPIDTAGGDEEGAESETDGEEGGESESYNNRDTADLCDSDTGT